MESEYAKHVRRNGHVYEVCLKVTMVKVRKLGLKDAKGEKVPVSTRPGTAALTRGQQINNRVLLSKTNIIR